MGPLPYKGKPEDVLPEISSLASELVSAPPVSAFCLGRTSDLTLMKEKHGCNQIFALYASDIAHDMVLVEDTLEKALCGHVKYYGDVEFEVAEETAHASFVYLAVWTVGSEKRVPAV